MRRYETSNQNQSKLYNNIPELGRNKDLLGMVEEAVHLWPGAAAIGGGAIVVHRCTSFDAVLAWLVNGGQGLGVGERRCKSWQKARDKTKRQTNVGNHLCPSKSPAS